MFVEERQACIIEMLQHMGKVKVKALSEKFAVTEDCIRKDLAALEKSGLLKRAYGGAVLARANLHTVEVRSRKNVDVKEKQVIAKKAVSLVKNKDMVFLDVSTINIEIAKLLLTEDKAVTVVTNMIEILNLIAQPSKLQVIFIGGVLNESCDGFWSGMTAEWIAKFKPDIAFAGVVGIDVVENRLSTYEVDDGINKTAILKASKMTYVVAETSKFNSDGNYTYATLDEVSGIITDAMLDATLQKKLREYGVKII